MAGRAWRRSYKCINATRNDERQLRAQKLPSNMIMEQLADDHDIKDATDHPF